MQADRVWNEVCPKVQQSALPGFCQWHQICCFVWHQVLFQKRTIETGKKKQPLIPALYWYLSNLPCILLKLEMMWNIKLINFIRKKLSFSGVSAWQWKDSNQKLSSRTNMCLIKTLWLKLMYWNRTCRSGKLSHAFISWCICLVWTEFLES